MAITISGSGITSANIADGTIVNADVNDVAASKLTGALPAIDGSSLTGLASGGNYAFGAFSRSFSGGTSSITGLSFQPVGIIAWSGKQWAGQGQSMGIQFGTTKNNWGHFHSSTANEMGIEIANGKPFQIYTTSTDRHEGHITSWNSDGFTITWSNAGNPGGTGRYLYLAFG